MFSYFIHQLQYILTRRLRIILLQNVHTSTVLTSKIECGMSLMLSLRSWSFIWFYQNLAWKWAIIQDYTHLRERPQIREESLLLNIIWNVNTIINFNSTFYNLLQTMSFVCWWYIPNLSSWFGATAIFLVWESPLAQLRVWGNSLISDSCQEGKAR